MVVDSPNLALESLKESLSTNNAPSYSYCQEKLKMSRNYHNFNVFYYYWYTNYWGHLVELSRISHFRNVSN